MLELAILGLLKERSMHGYQLSKRLTDTLGGFWRVSYGSLYPSLRRLEKDGAVEQVFDEQEVGRRKNVYRITDKGEDVFIHLLEEAGNRLLERRRAFLEERLSTIQTSLAATGGGFDTYTLSLMQHGRDTTEQDIDWLNGLIAAERRQPTPTREGTKRRQTRALRRKERTT